jgi:hypothetical protein
MRVMKWTCSAVISCALLIYPLPVDAHLHAQHAPAQGIAIANITHGQMAVIADYRTAILALAERQAVADPLFRRLKNYQAIQFVYCLWGLMPGSVTDERSPFNECAHAYLAATQALLMHMVTTSAESAPVHDLARRIEVDMQRKRASLSLCLNSGEGFNTAWVITPRLSDVFFHLPTLLTLLCLGCTMFGASRFFRRVQSPLLAKNVSRAAPCWKSKSG